MDEKANNKISVREVLSVAAKIVFGLLIALLVFVAGTLTYDKYVKKSRIPSFFGTSVLIIATPSMSGAIDTGDMIIVKKGDSYAVGDVITYLPAADSTSVTHRIVRIEGDKYFTKGDANVSEDPDPVFITQIAGKVTRVIPKVGIVIEWLRTWQGIAFLIAVGTVTVAIVMIAGDRDDESEYGEYELLLADGYAFDGTSVAEYEVYSGDATASDNAAKEEEKDADET